MSTPSAQEWSLWFQELPIQSIPTARQEIATGMGIASLAPIEQGGGGTHGYCLPDSVTAWLAKCDWTIKELDTVVRDSAVVTPFSGMMTARPSAKASWTHTSLTLKILFCKHTPRTHTCAKMRIVRGPLPNRPWSFPQRDCPSGRRVVIVSGAILVCEGLLRAVLQRPNKSYS